LHLPERFARLDRYVDEQRKPNSRSAPPDGLIGETMKVVLFCGGLGTRLKEFSDTIPKPMVPLGYRPVVWHVMRYYAHYGHKDFVLCLGHRGDLIKEYFLNYNECLSNDFTLSGGGRDVHLLQHDISDWTISFVDTGQMSNVGQRLVAVRQILAGEDVFFANYADGLTDVDLDCQLAQFRRSEAIASLLLVRPTNQTFHFARVDGDDRVSAITPIQATDLWINGGFFIFGKEIFDHIQDGEELVQEPFERLVKKQRLVGYRHEGFWCCMDTFKDKKLLDDMYNRGDRPWEVWRKPGGGD
jgi:glucose-1-phosphate cytidylyltransferase